MDSKVTRTKLSNPGGSYYSPEVLLIYLKNPTTVNLLENYYTTFWDNLLLSVILRSNFMW